MGRSQETFNKKEKEKKRLQKKKEKEQRKEARQVNSDKGKGLDDMLAYVDEYGNLSSTPPDPTKLKKVNAEEILISTPRLDDQDEADAVRKGKVSYFNNSKGYGFVTDDADGERIFIHVNDLPGPVAEDTRLQFMVKKGPRGLQAVDIEIIG